MRKVAVIASAGGNGKTTVGRELAGRLGIDPSRASHRAAPARPRGDLERQPGALRGAVWGREALIPYAPGMRRSRRSRYPVELAQYPVLRLRTRAGVNAFLNAAGGP